MNRIRISVGYGWAEGPVSKDQRWKDLRDCCKVAAEHGRKLAAAMLSRSVIDEDQTANPHDVDLKLPTVSVARLRGSVGRFTWESVRQHIDDSDILLFDITPTKSFARKMVVSENIWIEVGYAFANSNKSVFLVHADKAGHRSLPSDLRGLVVGHVASSPEKSHDPSLRQSLASEVKRLILGRIE